MPHHSRAIAAEVVGEARGQLVPLAMARGVPPSPWIETIADGLPAARADSASICATTCSQPSATTSTAPTFGCWQYAASVSCVTCMSGPSWPQPARWGSATAPATAAAMRSVTTAEQTTVGTTRT